MTQLIVRTLELAQRVNVSVLTDFLGNCVKQVLLHELFKDIIKHFKVVTALSSSCAHLFFFTDLCELKTCLNSGTCFAGNCVCAEGFSGDLCQNSQCEFAPVSQGTSIRLVGIDGAR